MGNHVYRQYNDYEVIDNIQRSYFRPQEIKVIHDYLDPYKNPARESTEKKFKRLSEYQIANDVHDAIIIGGCMNLFIDRLAKKVSTWELGVKLMACIIYMNLNPLTLYDRYQYNKIKVEREKIDADYFKQIGPVESQVIKDYGKILDNEYRFRKEMLTSNFTRPEDYVNSNLDNKKKAYFTEILEQSSKIRSHQPIVTQIVNNVLNQSSKTNHGKIGPEKRLRTFAEIEADKGGKSGLGDIKQYEQGNLESKGWSEESSVENKTEYKYVDPYEARKGKKRWD